VNDLLICRPTKQDSKKYTIQGLNFLEEAGYLSMSQKGSNFKAKG
jgi:hypothetical protein